MSYRRFEGGFGASQNWNWQAGVSHHTSVVGAFSRDAFQIAFGGNAAYLRIKPQYLTSPAHKQ